MAAKENRILLLMACTVCRSRNYVTSKNRQKTQGRLERNKFCSPCRKHTPHREEKI